MRSGGFRYKSHLLEGLGRCLQKMRCVVFCPFWNLFLEVSGTYFRGFLEPIFRDFWNLFSEHPASIPASILGAWMKCFFLP